MLSLIVFHYFYLDILGEDMLFQASCLYQAKLLNASGDVVAEMPYETKQAIFKVKREKMTSDEVWQLKFVKIQEDMSFQIGVDAIPLGSVDTESVIGRRLNFQ